MATPNITHLNNDKTMTARPPVVVVLGHVDHGKCVSPSTRISIGDGRILTAAAIWNEYKDKGKVVDSTPDRAVIELQENLEVHTLEGEEITKKPISHLWRLKHSGKLREIHLASGDNVQVTPEHPFLIMDAKGAFRYKEARELSEGDFVVVPQRFSCREQQLTAIKKDILLRLASAKNFVVFFEASSSFITLLLQSHPHTLFAKGLISSRVWGIKSQRRMRIEDVITLAQYFHMPLSDVYDQIAFVKNAIPTWRAGHTSIKIRLPRTKSDFSSLAYAVGCLVGDGHVSTTDAILANHEKEIQTEYIKILQNIFQLSPRKKERRRKVVIESGGGRTFARFISSVFDIPAGRKAHIVSFPDAVLFSHECLKEFLAGWFDTDGYVSKLNYSVEITSKSEQLVRIAAIALLRFGVHAVVFSKSKFWYLRVANNPYVERFLQAIPARLSYKRKRIREARERAGTSRIFDLTPLAGSLLQEVKLSNHAVPYFDRYRGYQHLSRPFLTKLLQYDRDLFLSAFGNDVKKMVNPGELSLVKVKWARDKANKGKYVFDFTVPETHNFIAERVIVHNTALLDAIRQSNVAEKESGGITQHIGAYVAEFKGKPLTFIDTPGHEAFSAVRSRGAKVADIGILVVAADEGVKPQTKEAIDQANEAGIPLVVALNKADRPEAQPEKVKQQLAEAGLYVESYGGKVPSVQTSAVSKQGIKELLEMVLLMADLQDLKADAAKPAQGVVIESYLDPRRGPAATLLVRQGSLKTGDIVGTASAFGKVRILENFQGKELKTALPAIPCLVLGFEEPPHVGEEFFVFETEQEAASNLKAKEQPGVVAKDIPRDTPTLDIILQVDVVGSLEVVQGALMAIPQEKVALRFVNTGVGEIGENDVKTAIGTGARIIGFRTKVNAAAADLAQREGAKIENFEVIYELVERIRALMERSLEPESVKKELGAMKVLAVFLTDKNRQIIGGKVTSGEIRKGSKLELFRNEEETGKGKIINLQKQKKDVGSVKAGEECGILYEGAERVQEGDVLKAFVVETQEQSL